MGLALKVVERKEDCVVGIVRIEFFPPSQLAVREINQRSPTTGRLADSQLSGASIHLKKFYSPEDQPTDCVEATGGNLRELLKHHEAIQKKASVASPTERHGTHGMVHTEMNYRDK